MSLLACLILGAGWVLTQSSALPTNPCPAGMAWTGRTDAYACAVLMPGATAVEPEIVVNHKGERLLGWRRPGRPDCLWHLRVEDDGRTLVWACHPGYP